MRTYFTGNNLSLGVCFFNWWVFPLISWETPDRMKKTFFEFH